MIKIIIESEDGYAGFLLTHEGIHENPSVQRYNDIKALWKSLDELLEKIHGDALINRLVRNLHELKNHAHPSVRKFATDALANLG